MLAGRPWSLHLFSIVSNIGEAWLVGVLLERWVERPFRLETLHQVGYFIAAIGIAVGLGGIVGSFALLYLPAGGNYGFGKLWWTWVSVRGLGMLTVAPAVIALGTMSRRSIDIVWRDGKGSLSMLLGVTVIAYMIVSVELPQSDVLALLALLVVVYPFILWIAARNEPAWTYVSLLLLTLVVVWRLGHGGGLLRRNVEVGQAFLLVSSLWSLTLAVVWEQQRRAMRAPRTVSAACGMPWRPAAALPSSTIRGPISCGVPTPTASSLPSAKNPAAVFSRACCRRTGCGCST